MESLKPLSITEKVLIHLSKVKYDCEAEKVPKEISQEGIAKGVGISRSHVPRAVKELLNDGLIEEFKRYIESGHKRIKVYLMTARGISRAQEIEERILSRIVSAKIQGTIVEGMTIRQIENAFHRRINILKLTGEEEFIDLDTARSSGFTDLTDSPKTEIFLDREDSLEQLKIFLKSRAMILTIYGAKGIGTSSLVKYFIEMMDEWNILWISLVTNRTVEEIEGRISSFAEGMSTPSDSLMNSPLGSNMLLIFDGYFDVDEDVVELISNLVERREGAKIIVTCRDSTPSYNRFYRKEHIESSHVLEIVLKGLPEKEAKKLLGNEKISEDAFRRIYALSRGSPMILKMLREKDDKGLSRNTTFTNEEIRFLIIESSIEEI